MTRITLTFNGKTWTVTYFEWGYKQGQIGNQPHGDPIPLPILLHLVHNHEQDELFEAAKSSGDRFDGTIDYIRGGTTVKQIPLVQASVTEYKEIGEFDRDPAVGGGIYHRVVLLVDSIEPEGNNG